MPGSGLYSAAQMTTQNEAFLNSWTGIKANPGMHSGLNDVDPDLGCLACHSPAGILGSWTSLPQWSYLDFTVFALGTNLTNDHPVGVQLPDTNIYDFNAPTATPARLKFYDANGNNRADPSEIRFYNTGEGYEVECASCHDPHGVPSGGPGTNTLLRPSFLRVSNANSAVCLTCHNK